MINISRTFHEQGDEMTSAEEYRRALQDAPDPLLVKLRADIEERMQDALRRKETSFGVPVPDKLPVAADAPVIKEYEAKGWVVTSSHGRNERMLNFVLPPKK